MAPGSVGVDIVVNNFNYGRFVSEAVDSALAQDHARVSVIVVDDGSSDDSRERLRRYEDRVTLLFKHNGGQASAVNAGFARCQGDIVMFLDADDRLSRRAASRAAAAFEADPSAARLQFQVAPIDESGSRLERAAGHGTTPRPSGDLRSIELASPFEMPTVPTSANAFRTDLLREIMPVPEERYGSWGADYYLVHLSTLLGTVIFLEEVGAFYRVHGTNAFQPSAPVLDLKRIQNEIRYQMVTLECLGGLADQLGLEYERPILSLSNLALRVISRRLAPRQHPVPTDRLPGLLAACLTALSRRHELSSARRIAQAGVLASMAVSPAPVACRLAELILFPELRAPGAWDGGVRQLERAEQSAPEKVI